MSTIEHHATRRVEADRRPAPAYIQRHPRGDLIRVPCGIHNRFHTHGYSGHDPIGEPLMRSSHCHPEYWTARRQHTLPFDTSADPIVTSEPFRAAWVTPSGHLSATYIRHISTTY